jgi:hypothetical protein
MITSKLDLINEQTSPLFRIMWVYNVDDPHRKQFGNNICAFHVGNGIIMTVAHNLRTESGIINSIGENFFQENIYSKLNSAQQQVFNQLYILDKQTNVRHANITDPNVARIVSENLRQINFDTRWATLTEKKICTPHLIVQLRDKLFYNDASLTSLFKPSHYFPEPALNRHTFIIQLELIKTFYSDDIALYKITNTNKKIIDGLPSVNVDFNVVDDSISDLYCLQSSPGSSLGRLLNNATMEGYSDHWSLFNDRVGGNYVMEGLRYLIRGYFRFGSSGAPYVYYNKDEKQFKACAIQSEASPIQLSINNNREGNFQYVNAIASPLNNIKNEIRNLIS